MFYLSLTTEDVFGTEVFGIFVDFTKGSRVFEEIKELLTGFEIGILGVSLHAYVCVSKHMHVSVYAYMYYMCQCTCVYVCVCMYQYLCMNPINSIL